MSLSNGETITVNNHFDSDYDYGMDQIHFADAVTYNLSQISARANDLHGTFGDDLIVGSVDGETIWALDGDDRLEGGAGDDTLSGGLGADAFVFKADDGADTVEDFSDGADLIQFDITGITFADLGISADGADTIVSYDTDDTIRLKNVASTTIDENDFVFS